MFSTTNEKAITDDISPEKKVENKIPSRLKIDFPHTNPKEVYVTENGTEFKLVATEEIEKKCGFTWIESYVIDKAFKTRHQEITSEISKKNEQRVKDYLTNIDKYIAKLALRNMEGVGYLTVVREEIKKDDTITIYTGELRRKSNSAVYAKLTQIPIHGDRWKPNAWIIGSIDAQDFGNISRFMPHLPNPEELERADLPGINKEEVATAIDSWDAIYSGKCLPVFTALENMKPGHPVGFSYGPSYWKEKPFWLLSKKGEKLIEVRYDASGKIVKANQSFEHDNISIRAVA